MHASNLVQHSLIHYHSSLQATFTWASAEDLGQGLGTRVADLVVVQVDLFQRRVDL